MKVRITKVDSANNANISATIEIYKDDNSLLWTGTRGFVSLATSQAIILTELKQSVKNIANQYIFENASKLKETVEANLNKDIDLG